MRGRYTRLFVVVLFVLAILRVVISALFPLSGDEAYHWEWSRHLAPGYYDHPPFTAYVIFVFTKILGDTETGVRFGAIVLMTLASIIMYKFGRDISGDDRVAFWSGMLVNVVPLLNIFFVYMSTDPASIFFWALMLWLVYRAIFQDAKVYWYLFGAALGGALMTKFLNVLMIPSVALFILLSRKYRRLFVSKEPYIAGVIAVVVMLPMIIWNATHGWATFYFNFAKRQMVDASPLHFLEYVGGQAVAVSPLIFIGFVYLIVRCCRRRFSEEGDLGIFIAVTSSVMFGFFLITSFLRSVGLHWPAAGYLSMCAGLPYIAFKEENSLIARHARKSVIIALAVLLASYSLLFAAYYLPGAVEKAVSKFSAGSAGVYELHGWKEIGAEAEMRAKKYDAILISPSYSFCSMLSFYTPSKMQLHMFGKGAVHGLSYVLWDGDYSQFTGSDAIWVYKEAPKPDDWELMRVSFEEVHDIEEYHLRREGETVRTFYFVRCEKLVKYGPD